MRKRRPSGQAQRASTRRSPREFRLVIAIGVVMIALVVLHTPYVNGPPYWMWGWHRLPFWRGWPGAVLAAVPFFLAQFAHDRTATPSRARLAVGLGSLMVAALILELNTLVISSGRQAPDRLWTLVEDSRVTSYYTDALLTSKVLPQLKDWFTWFPEFIGRLHIHARNKPPGSMLYYLAFARRFSTENHHASSFAGLAIGVLATGAIPAVYFLARALGRGANAAFFAASATAVCPGLIVFFPELDQVYAGASAIVIGSWVLALRRQSRAWSLACGLLLAGVCFFTFNLLVLGWFMAGAGLYFWRVARIVPLGRVLEAGTIVVSCVVAFHTVLWLMVHYDVIATFKAALVNQAAFSANVVRPYPQTAFFDLLDYALGLGWMSAVLFIVGRPRAAGADRAFTWLSFSQLLVVAGGALLAVETARVWAFMFPLALPVVGARLSEWSPRQRAAFFAVALATIVVLGENLTFFSLSPE
jgi:hypothetical protein